MVLGGHVSRLAGAHDEGKFHGVIGHKVGGPKIQEGHECRKNASCRKDDGVPSKFSPNHGRIEIPFFRQWQQQRRPTQAGMPQD